MQLETLATTCFVQIAHGASHAPGDESIDISIVNGNGQVLIGTTVHQSELDEAIGPVLASEEMARLQRGSYVHNLRPVEILAIRGTLHKRIETDLN